MAEAGLPHPSVFFLSRWLDFYSGRAYCLFMPSNQYYVTAEIKPNDDIQIIRIEDAPTLRHHHSRACDHVRFLRSVGQRHEPHGKLETKPLLRALAAWPLAVLKTIASMRYGTMGQETDDMPRGLRPFDDDTDGLALVRFG